MFDQGVVRAEGCAFERNDWSVGIRDFAVVVLERCGFNKHKGRVFMTMDDETDKGSWNCTMIVKHCVDFEESR